MVLHKGFENAEGGDMSRLMENPLGSAMGEGFTAFGGDCGVQCQVSANIEDAQLDLDEGLDEVRVGKEALEGRPLPKPDRVIDGAVDFVPVDLEKASRLVCGDTAHERVVLQTSECGTLFGIEIGFQFDGF